MMSAHIREDVAEGRQGTPVGGLECAGVLHLRQEVRQTRGESKPARRLTADTMETVWRGDEGQAKIKVGLGSREGEIERTRSTPLIFF